MIPIPLYSDYEYWQQYHKVTFDGPNRRIIINPEVVELNVLTDVYSSWKEWVLMQDNAKYPAAIRTTGGDSLTATTSLDGYFFLINGWKLVPPTDTLLDDIELDGNLYDDAGGDIVDISNSAFRLLRQTVSSKATVIEIPVTASVNVTASLGSVDYVATASYIEQPVSIASGQTVATASYVESLGNVQISASIDSVLTASYVQTVADPVSIASGQTIATASYIQTPVYIQSGQSVATSSYVQTIGDPVTLASGQYVTASLVANQSIATASYVSYVENIGNVSFSGSIDSVATASYVSYVDSPVTIAPNQQVTASLAPGTTVSASLSPQQETMLLEMYRLLGLDPTRPLVVSPSSRTAGSEISQSISASGSTYTAQRL